MPLSKESSYQLLHRIGIALSAERNRDRLLDLILTAAQELCNADGGTLYLRNEADELEFTILKNRSLNVHLGGTSEHQVTYPALPLFDLIGGVSTPNRHNVATYAAHAKHPIHISNAYDSQAFDFSGTVAFDQRSGYKSISFFTLPLINAEDNVIGVLQLLNALDDDGNVIPFAAEHQEIVRALASQAAVALDNKLLMEAHRQLLESFIKLMAAAIDAKSPYTGQHCERVPVICEMLVDAACASSEPQFADFDLNEEERYELHIAAWLHDCGKVTTPTHVMDKSTKLETITDRISELRTRFELLKRDAQIEYLEAVAAGSEPANAATHCAQMLTQLDDELAFLERINVGGEYLPPEAQARIAEIASRKYSQAGQAMPLLSPNEVLNLSVSRGTLTDEERYIINGHMVHTARMLEALPFPRNLRRVPEYATSHHEKLDGTGYPRGLYAMDTSLPARAMAIADIFEALTAGDRPYKQAKKLSETMRIMGFMKRDNHIDPALFDLFVSSKVYRRYAECYLAPTLIDEVDEASLLSILPKSFDIPSAEARAQRKAQFLPDYEARFPLKQERDSPIRLASSRPRQTRADHPAAKPTPGARRTTDLT